MSSTTDFIIERNEVPLPVPPAPAVVEPDPVLPIPAGLDRKHFVSRLQAASKLLPRQKAQELQAVILDNTGIRAFRVGMVSPESIDATDAIARILKTTTQQISFEKIDFATFEAYFTLAYNLIDPEETHRAAARMTSPWTDIDAVPVITPVMPDEQQCVEVNEADSQWKWDDRDVPPTTRDFAERVLLEAFIAGASDIHVEAGPHDGRIRFRCDSLLHIRWVHIPIERAKQLVNALASMAGVKQELLKFRRHDSTIKVKVNRRNGTTVETEYRVVFGPSKPWPEVVLRINSEVITDLANIGFLPHQLDEIRRGLSRTEGLILITGPTGSGKSNTLQSVFAEFEKDDALKIVEFGDPIEFLSSRRTQMEITTDSKAANDPNAFTWAEALKTSLRMDPNVIAPGEVRDATAASALLNAALTGHVCATTLHTNNIAVTFARLKELHVPPYLQASATNLIVNQRLIRVLCPECKAIDENTTKVFNQPIFKATGCAHCYGKGYKGQTAMGEVLLIRPEIRDWITQGMEGREIVEKAIARGWMQRIQEAAEQKLRAGITSLLEIERVMNRDDEYTPVSSLSTPALAAPVAGASPSTSAIPKTQPDSYPDLLAAQERFYRAQAENIEAQMTLAATNVHMLENVSTLAKDIGRLTRNLSIMMERANKSKPNTSSHHPTRQPRTSSPAVPPPSTTSVQPSTGGSS